MRRALSSNVSRNSEACHEDVAWGLDFGSWLDGYSGEDPDLYVYEIAVINIYSLIFRQIHFFISASAEKQSGHFENLLQLSTTHLTVSRSTVGAPHVSWDNNYSLMIENKVGANISIVGENTR